MFSVPQDRDVEIRALRAGAGGFLSKNADIEAVGARPALGRRRRGGGVSRSLTNHLIELLRTHGRERQRHAPGQEPADDA
jgi:DNA-binding NarL/FixJ family response regulator